MSRTKALKLADEIEEGYLKLSSYDARKFELAAEDDFLKYSSQGWCKVIFLYKSNEMNKRLKRSGRVANYTKGGRIATRNLALIPTADHPSGGRTTPSGLFAYYDASRANAVKNSDGTSTGLTVYEKMPDGPAKGQWRCVGSDRITVVTSFWDAEQEKWISLQ